MTEIYVPFDRELYDDLVRFSDGKLDPVAVAEQQLHAWVVRGLESGDDSLWGERFDEIAEKYAPEVLKREASREVKPADQKALVWKNVIVSSGSDVRMSYGGQQHYATIKDGNIVDQDGKYSPSEWASKIAGGTSRNAWRDLWFKEPNAVRFVSAQLLRKTAEIENEKFLEGVYEDVGGGLLHD